jgi:hypothetical protein
LNERFLPEQNPGRGPIADMECASLEGKDSAMAARVPAPPVSPVSSEIRDPAELALTTLGKLAALIEWLSPQHADVAGMLERGETQRGLQRLEEITKAWQQIVAAYASLAKMLGITLKELPVHELDGEALLNEFGRQLAELQTALQKQDFVLLSDILQYEMDGVVANWMALLETTLGVVEDKHPGATDGALKVGC